MMCGDGTQGRKAKGKRDEGSPKASFRWGKVDKEQKPVWNSSQELE